jgi:tripartite-type tricarboxylate transporter receptor subunit TctC
MLFVIAVVAPTLAPAQPWPAKPIRMVVPFPPGGSVDAVARLIVPKMTESLGQSVIIDNRTGASGNIGMEIVARAAGDGYTLLINTVPIVANPSLFSKLPFQPQRDFAPISLVVTTPSVIFVNPSLPVHNVKELIALAKAKPGTIKYTSAGPGTLPHLATEFFKYYTHTDMTHVGYKGGGPGIIAVISGECELTIQSLVAAGGQITAGRLRALAVTTRTRLPQLPDVPTVAESGVPGYVAVIHYGMVAPAGTPRPIVERLNAELNIALKSDDVRARIADEGGDPLAGTPEQQATDIDAEETKWGALVRKLGLKAE